VVNEYNFGTNAGISLAGGSGVVASVAPVPGIYNVIGTATGFNGSISCRLVAASSGGGTFSATAAGKGTESVTAAETGAMSVGSLSVIEARDVDRPRNRYVGKTRRR
jgi:hypothetical protein